ncbi:MAG: serine/threonine protein kinase [Planctomycetaceae bacterium]|nr:serine/threonine protein kinase [Planctomycetaceae bacterium]
MASEELVRVLIHEWQIVGVNELTPLRGLSDTELLDHLARTNRFRTSHGTISLVTKLHFDAWMNRDPSSVLVEVNGATYLNLYKFPGSQGPTYLAVRRKLNATEQDLVVLKFQNRAKTDEGKTIQAIECPYVVQLVDTDSSSGTLVLQYIDGKTLSELLKQNRRLSVCESLRLGIEIGTALQHLHKNGLIHKDVKPLNIIRCSQAWHLLDFGLASVPSLTQWSGIEGTPYYIAPEILLKIQPDERADVFGLAATIYCSLFGYPPHFSRAINPKMSGSAKQLDTTTILVSDPTITCNLRDVRPEVIAPLASLVVQALSANRDDRPKSMSDFVNRLVAIQTQLSDIWQLRTEVWKFSENIVFLYQRLIGETCYTNQLRQSLSKASKSVRNCLLQFDSADKAIVEHLKDQSTDNRIRELIERTQRLVSLVKHFTTEIDYVLGLSIANDPEIVREYYSRCMEGLRSIWEKATELAHAWSAYFEAIGYVEDVRFYRFSQTNTTLDGTASEGLDNGRSSFMS